MSTKRYFTVAEANAHVDQLHSVFVGVMQIRSQIKQHYELLDAAGFAPSQDDADQLPDDAPADIVSARARFFGLVETLREHVAQIQATGCTIKDIEAGLVDWPARRANRDILLCWRFGEAEVGYWHELDTGVAGRRPISELDEIQG